MKQMIIDLLAKETKLSKKEIENLLEVPPNPELGDYAFPCFALSKKLKKAPNKIAEDLAATIKPPKEVERLETKGPYLNFFINTALQAEQTLNQIQKEKNNYGSSTTGKGKTVVLEFPSPNTNKPLHIGHVRNLVLGQALTNLLKSQGSKVKPVNLNNDRGVHICKSMVAYQKFGNGLTPEKDKKKSDHFVGDWYVKFAQEAKKDKKLEEAAQSCLQKWEANDKPTRALWKKMNAWAFKGFAETYQKFGYQPEKEYYESEIYDKGRDIMTDAFKKGLLEKKEDGALYASFEKQGLGEKIVLRADGTSIYITQDIFLATIKQKEFKPERSLILTAIEQDYHFKVLHTLLQHLGYSWAKASEHISYGLVHLESGRLKSREGNVVDADDLIDEVTALATKELTKRYKTLGKTEMEKRAKAITFAAMRYYFLRVDKRRDVTFKPEESISFEGDTGPYLLYTYARAKSILRKTKTKPTTKPKELNAQEKALITHLATFPATVQRAHDQLAPNQIANFSFELAQKFNEFYHHTKVIGSDDEAFKLSLVENTAQTIKNALTLLGIDVIEQM
ncbi:arginine--tRNA ligase [Candidatus Pacearchaeota archaeon]|nr:arginine--tRNA ligase [Candidatus Pacearchaeota archaeon]